MARRVNSRDPGAKSQFCVICGKWPATVRPKVPGPAWCEQCGHILEAEQADRAGE